MASPKEVGEEPEMTCCSCCNMRTLFKCSTVVVLVFVNLLNYMDRYTIAGGLMTSLDDVIPHLRVFHTYSDAI